MDYGMIGKIEKAKRYAEEPQRITFNNLHLHFTGDNNSYDLSLDSAGWNCTCPGYQKQRICPHVMAMERRFRPMLKRDPQPYAPGQNVVSDVEKAKRYSEEPDRLRFDSFDATFAGNNSHHQFTYKHGVWNCDCDFFKGRGVCSHTMAMERILKGMLEVPAAINK